VASVGHFIRVMLRRVVSSFRGYCVASGGNFNWVILWRVVIR